MSDLDSRLGNAENLEHVINEKVKPIIDEAMKKYLGITVNEIEADISDKLRKSPLLDVEVDISVPFKKAKQKFKETYLLKLLKLKYGNVSLVAEIAGCDRRSVHRLVRKFGIDVHGMREEMVKVSYLKKVAVSDLIEKTLDVYKPVLDKERMQSLYESVPQMSGEIIDVLPDKFPSLKEAERLFEKNYIRQALEAHEWNISKTARSIGLAFETLHRKMKDVSISRPE